MELEAFRKDFLEHVAARAAADMDFHHTAFVLQAAAVLTDMEEIIDLEVAYHRGTGSRNRAVWVDGYAFDEADGSARLVLVVPTGADHAKVPTLTQTEVRSFFQRLRGFVEDSVSGRLSTTLDPSTPECELARLLQETIGGITRFRLYLVSDAALSTRVQDWPEGAIGDVPVEYHIWDISRFHRVASSGSGRDELVIDFRNIIPGGIPCIEAGIGTESYKGHLCVLPGQVLADIYDAFGSRLLEGNVRSFLSVRGKINQGIRRTIMTEPDMFFAYNNGIAATCSDAVIESTPAGPRLFKATDLQIVNGGQTTASLSMARRRDRADLSRVHVQMKLSVVDPDTASTLIPSISRFANSQNRVSEADFFSNHDFHRRMEQISRRLWAPAVAGAQHETRWFYERARGQYQNAYAAMTPAEAKRFQVAHPKAQVITKTDLAKHENAWRGLPHTVSRGAQKNFVAFAEYVASEWDRSPDDFNDEYFRRIVARTILFRTAERIVSAQPWYQGGYRANIVAYTVARLSLLVGQTKDAAMDFRGIWQRQGLSPAVERQVASIARAMYAVITMPQAGIQNVTEWCKRDLCWQRAKTVEVPLLPEFAAELASRKDDRIERRDGRRQQEQDDGIARQAEVLELGADFWSALRVWAADKRILTPEADQLLGIAIAMPRKIPSEYQSARLMVLKDRAESEGFLHTNVRRTA